MSRIRPPAVAGLFYPANPAQLAAMVDQFLNGVQHPTSQIAPKVLVAPHAGYIYSGSTAAHAYALLQSARDRIRRVVLLGPTHRVAVNGLALPESEAFATPLGNLAIDRQTCDALRQLPGVIASDRVHAQEHSLEVHLPFLQRCLTDFELVPIAVGHAPAPLVAQVLEAVWDDERTLIVVSSDLSHFHDYATAQALDKATIAQVLAGQPTLHTDQACGAYPLNGLLTALKHHSLSGRLLAACNSGDTAGDRQRVVGYASFAYQAEEIAHD